MEILEAEACKDHIHMLVSIPPKYSVSQIMGYLKGKESLMVFEKYANMKYKYGNRHFWCRGYYVDTVGRNKKAIAEYIRNQLQEDISYDPNVIGRVCRPVYGQAGKRRQIKNAPLGAAGERVAVGKPFDEHTGSAGLMPQGGSACYRHGR